MGLKGSIVVSGQQNNTIPNVSSVKIVKYHIAEHAVFPPFVHLCPAPFL